MAARQCNIQFEVIVGTKTYLAVDELVIIDLVQWDTSCACERDACVVELAFSSEPSGTFGHGEDAKSEDNWPGEADADNSAPGARAGDVTSSDGDAVFGSKDLVTGWDRCEKQTYMRRGYQM